MGHRIIKLLVFIVIAFQVSLIYSQTNNWEGFTQLMDFQYDEIVNDSLKSLPDGRYYKTHYIEGVLRGIETIGYKDKRKHGESIIFSKGLGTIFLSSVVNYRKGIKQGYFFRTDNHTFSTEGYYQNDKKEGLWKYSKNGFLEEITYSKGVKSGAYKNVNDDMITTGQYRKGLKHGLWKIVDSSIGLGFQEIYKNGKLLSKKSIEPF